MSERRGTIHLVNLANGEPFTSSQKRIVESIGQHTSRKVVIHSLTMDTIRDRPWYPFMTELFDRWHQHGRRDGYFCAWKPFIIRDVYMQMGGDDIVYYTDSSQYCLTGFRTNVDRFIDIVKERGAIPGSVGFNQPNWNNLCDKRHIWDMMGAGHLHEQAMLKPHMLASWVAFAKNSQSQALLDEWCHWCQTKDVNGVPLVTQQHTVDQMILNILLWRLAHANPEFPGYKVFHHPKLLHDCNKDFNRIHEVLNSFNMNSTNDLFVTPSMLPDRHTP